jgi:two-component system sensor histidine kinase SenX3
LKTPIGALSLLAEAVLSSADEPEAVRHFAGRMEAEAGRLSELVGDLIDLSRLQGADPLKDAQPVDVDALVSEAVDTTRLQAQNALIEIVVGGETGLQTLGVEGQLVTALRNLLTNAINYSPRGTKVAIATRMSKGVVEISITDQGMGIPENELSRVFERFYRVDQARSRVTGGTGLGLSIVKHVAENHGGEVGVWSALGEGSTFTLRLPPYVEAEIPVVVRTPQEENTP